MLGLAARFSRSCGRRRVKVRRSIRCAGLRLNGKRALHIGALIATFRRAASARIDSAARDIMKDLFASGLFESVFVQVRILVRGGNPCIADLHTQPPVAELNSG